MTWQPKHKVNLRYYSCLGPPHLPMGTENQFFRKYTFHPFILALSHKQSYLNTFSYLCKTPVALRTADMNVRPLDTKIVNETFTFFFKGCHPLKNWRRVVTLFF
ncbi:unnamed protein product [Meganyctiphanes norvegica]|uniref:Uncharacterized protein n=1 Tax=Meganyctiphanes norvegica TaxID=48144 RepID=A0AAV2RWF5_MEGNR